MHFNPADVQTIGIGLASFLSTLVAIFIFLSARKESLGRAMFLMVGAATIWSWFGFLYEIVSSLTLARDFRIISVMGIVWIGITTVYFSKSYLEERVQLRLIYKRVIFSITLVSALLTIILIGDIFGGRLIVGNLLLPTSQVLAPHAGPLLAVVIAYYIFCILFSSLLLSLRAKAGQDNSDTRQVEIIFSSLIIALTLGGTRFAPWYGVELSPIFSAFAAPLFAFAAFYSMKRYKLFNIEIAVAHLLIFALWTFAFFRLLLNLNSTTVLVDLGFFVAVLILGIFLMSSTIAEIRAEKKLARLTIEQVKSEFVTIAAHQLRIPFTTVRASLSHLSSPAMGQLSEEQHKLVGQGVDAINQLVHILDDLLDIVRITKGTVHFDVQQGDIRDIVHASANIFEDALKHKNLRLKIELPPAPLRALFDRGKMAFALESVIDNAIKYTPSDGSISIEAKEETEMIQITITDTGIGIPENEKERIFEKFFRGENAKELVPDGSGLGLYLAKSIITSHGGTITVTPSRENGGTTVIITLPSSDIK